MSKLKILFADDHPGERIFISQLIEEIGDFELTLCEDGRQALLLLENGVDFDVVITDFNMPFSNGGEVARAARARGIARIMVRSSENLTTLIPKLNLDYGLSDALFVISKRVERHETITELKKLLNSA